MGANEYSVLLKARLDTSEIAKDVAKMQAEIDKAFANVKTKQTKSPVVEKIKQEFKAAEFKISPTFDMSKINQIMREIQAKSGTVGKVSISSGFDEEGIQQIRDATVSWTDQTGKAYSEYVLVNSEIKATVKSVQNLSKEESVAAREREKNTKVILEYNKNLSKEYSKMQSLQEKASKFISANSGANLTDIGKQKMGFAQEMISAFDEKDLNKMKVAEHNFNSLGGTIVEATGKVKTFGGEMMMIARRTLESAATLGVMYGAINQIRMGVQYIKDLDKELTNVQVVTGMSEESVNKLGMEYNSLAKEMGVTTLEVAKGNLEFLRQGKSAEESSQLVRSSMMLSKLGNIEAAQSTEYLTSTLNGFKLEAESASDIVDKLIILDNNAATSAGEIASALQRSSGSASQAGVSFEELASYITVLSSTTRRSAETIGESLKTIFARMSDLKMGFDVEDGTSISNVEDALSDVNIKLRDSKNSFRDFSDVLQELAGKWGTLTEVEQANLGKQIAGTRQRELFYVLMTNMDKALEFQEIQTNASGLALERYEEYLGGVEAAQNRMNASWEKLVQGSIGSEMVSGFYDATAGVLDFIDAIGGIPVVLKVVTGLLILFNAELIKTKIIATGDLFSGILTGLRALIPAFGASTVAAEGSTAAWMAANVAALPFVLTIGAITAGLILGAKAIKDYADEQQILRDEINKTKNSLETEASTYGEYLAGAKKAAEDAGYYYDESGKMYHSGYHGLNQVQVKDMELLSEAQWKAKKSLEELTGTERDSIAVRERLGEATEEAAEKVAGYGEEYAGLSEIMKALIDAPIGDLVDKSMGGELGFEDIEKIPEEYLSALTVEGDKLRLNIDLIKELQLEKAKEAVQSAEIAKQKGEATAQEVAVLQLYYDQLLAESQNTFGQFNQTAWQYDELLWQISNDAISAGYTFADMEGNALTSAQGIYDYMSKSDANFNDFVSQAAIALGMTTQEVMNSIGSMVTQQYNNTVGMINSLNGMSTSLNDPRRGRGYSGGGVTSSESVVSLFTPVTGGGGYTSPRISGSGGGGSSSAASDKAAKQAEKLKEIEKDIAEARDRATKSLKNQLDIYKDMVDARKDLLDTMKEEREYQQDLEDKQSEVVDIRNQIAELSLDDSEEAKAQVLALQEQLIESQEELANLEYDRSIELQKSALDEEYDRMENIISSAIASIEGIDASSLKSFTSQLSKILSGIPSFHSGGVVGGKTNKEGERFAKLLEGERVLTPEQMSSLMNSTLPNMMRNSPQVDGVQGKIDIGQLMNFNISGNLDKSTIPSIQKIAEQVVEKLNGQMLSRGFTRTANVFGG